MFFIGVFGAESKQKEIKKLHNLQCKNCNGAGGTLIKSYSYFHFFFLPLFKWNEQYFVICDGCGAVYEINKEKGAALERGENIEITYWDLKDTNYGGHNNYGNHYIQRRCGKCGRNLERDFEFCPYCGNKIKE